jgi:hypothetical protein
MFSTKKNYTENLPCLATDTTVLLHYKTYNKLKIIKTEVIMKTLKFALVALILACTLAGMANTDGFKSKPRKAVSITYQEAIKNPMLKSAMKLQLDPGFLNTIEQLYVVEVTYNNVLYRILGSRQSWISFFKGPITITSEKCRIPYGDPIEN